VRTTKQLTVNALTSRAICEVANRRLRAVKLLGRLSSHSFRVRVITDLLTLRRAARGRQYLAGHAALQTTGCYEREQKNVTRNIVERISI
jgi:hypothetical protein